MKIIETHNNSIHSKQMRLVPTLNRNTLVGSSLKILRRLNKVPSKTCVHTCRWLQTLLYSVRTDWRILLSTPVLFDIIEYLSTLLRSSTTRHGQMISGVAVLWVLT